MAVTEYTHEGDEKTVSKAKVILSVICGITVLTLGFLVYRLYPRHVTLVLKGVQYQLHSVYHRRPVTVILEGTLHRSLSTKSTFDGTLDIHGATIPDRDNGKTLRIVFDGAAGGTIAYIHSHPLGVYAYGSIVANRSFNQFAILEFQPSGDGSGWTARNGLVIAAPARTVEQAVQLSNNLLHTYLNGYRLQLAYKSH